MQIAGRSECCDHVPLVIRGDKKLHALGSVYQGRRRKIACGQSIPYIMSSADFIPTPQVVQFLCCKYYERRKTLSSGTCTANHSYFLLLSRGLKADLLLPLFATILVDEAPGVHQFHPNCISFLDGPKNRFYQKPP